MLGGRRVRQHFAAHPAAGERVGIDHVVAQPQGLRDHRGHRLDADPLTGGGVRDKVLANAPAPEHGFYGVPKVIE